MSPSPNSFFEKIRSLASLQVPPDASRAVFIFVGFFVLYAATRDAMYFYDPVQYAAVIQNPLSQFSARVIFEWNHPLWYSVTKLFFSFLKGLGLPVSAYGSNQIFNALAGAAGLSCLYVFLRKFSPSGASLGWAALAGLCQAFWSRATGGQTYLPGTLFIFLCVWSLINYSRDPRPRSLAAACFSALAAAGFHAPNVVAFVLVFGVILWRAGKKNLVPHGVMALLIAAAGCFPYAWVQGFFENGGFGRWLAWGSGIVNGLSPRAGGTGQFSFHFLNGIPAAALTLWKSVLDWETWGPSVFLVAAAFIALVGLWLAPAAAPRRKLDRVAALVIAGALVLYGFLFVVWMPENPVYWSTHVFLLSAFAGVATSPLGGGETPVKKLAAASAAALLFINNFTGVIFTNMQGVEAAPWVATAESLRGLTPPGSPIVISGSREPYLKPYIPYFARRNRIAIQLEAISAYQAGVDPARLLAERIQSHLREGKPVYVLGDIRGAGDDFTEWGLTRERLDDVWRRYEFHPVHRFPRPAPPALYLLWPKDADPGVELGLIQKLEAVGLSHQLNILRLKRPPAS